VGGKGGGWGQGGEMTQAHMNNKTIKKCTYVNFCVVGKRTSALK
jgi:hypothetical protein